MERSGYSRHSDTFFWMGGRRRRSLCCIAKDRETDRPTEFRFLPHRFANGGEIYNIRPTFFLVAGQTFTAVSSRHRDQFDLGWQNLAIAETTDASVIQLPI